MKKALSVLLVSTAIGLLAVACGPSSEDCNALCDWVADVCTDRESCMEDCREASREDVSYAMDNCLDRTVSTCQSANCCLRFTYTDYYWRQNCI